VFGHYDISVNAEIAVFPNPLQRGHKSVASARTSEPRSPVIATESHEVNLTRLLEALQSPRHERMLFAQGLTRL